MIKCSVCGESFEGRVDAKYCSSTCRSKGNRATDNKLSVASGINATDNLATDKLGVTDKVIDIDVPCKVFSKKDEEGVVDLVRDLKLDLKKDLGIDSWSSSGIMIRPDITIQQVQNICSLIRAKNGNAQRVYV
jgi:hypothetical protein